MLLQKIVVTQAVTTVFLKFSLNLDRMPYAKSLSKIVEIMNIYYNYHY